MRRSLPAAVLAALLLPGAAFAAPPANDAPAGAVVVAPFTAENGDPAERTGEADVSEATADPGVPRCLGDKSFARTAWFRVPAADKPTRYRVQALTPSMDRAEAPDLALFVQPGKGGEPAVAEPQACDGPVLKAATDPSTGVELRVPAGRDLLVQAGRSEGQTARGVIVSVAAAPLEAIDAPLGDLASMAGKLVPGRAAAVTLAGALLTEEDPAQPACPASGSVWRKVTALRSGPHVAAVRGTAAGTLSVFAGDKPTGDNALACVNRAGEETLRASFTAKRGQPLWLRVGSDVPKADGVRLALSGPCDVQPLTAAAAARVRVVRLTARAVKVRVSKGCVKGLVVRLRRGGRTVATLKAPGAVTGTKTLRIKRKLRGRLSARVSARDAGRKGRMVRARS